MDPRLRDRLRGRLVKARDRLRHEIRRGKGLDLPQRDAVGELSLVDNHPADVGSDTFEREKDVGLRDITRETLRQVEDALRRMDGGSYGLCVRCGRAIAAERLEALPEAAFCRACQEAGELDLARYVDPPGRELLGTPFDWSHDADQVGYDAEDAWQDVARYGPAHSHTDAPPGELRGVVEPIEGIVYESLDAAGNHEAAVKGDRHTDLPATETARLVEGKPARDRGSRRR
ncbi:MAG: TraR/DksA C4-type zinc finger protein [bacterium]|nr:TraR/DksA C4-type zinc finger protein [bacterium]